MTETAKTTTFVGTAAVVLIIAIVARPRLIEFSADSMVGKALYSFDIDAPKRLKIVQFDESQSALSEFEVAQIKGNWSIPSKNGYPADANRQMSDAATSINHLEVLRVASEEADKHEPLGVIDPSSPNLGAGAEGVGTHVTMVDGKGDMLVNLIIGDEVKDRDGQFYVRRANQDVTYEVKIDPSKLSTRFEDWIEKDLLKLSPWDIRRIEIKDYSLERSLGLGGIEARIDPKSEMTLSYDDKESKWLADEIRLFDAKAKNYQTVELAENEELDSTKLNELKTALDDLKIVDVEKKPEGLSRDLKASEDFVKSNEAAQSLFLRGFLPTQGKSGDLEILSTDGEVICTMKNGVEYVLRFGDFQLAGGEATAAPEEGEEVKRDEIHRYLFVMARFDEAAIERPEQEDLPALPKETNESGGEATDGAAAEAADEPEDTDNNASDPDAADPDATEEDQAETSGDEADDEADNAADAGDSSIKQASAEEGAAEEASSATEDATEGTENSESDDFNETEQTSDETEQTKSDANTQSDANTDLDEIIEQRKTIEKENLRKLDEYNDKIKEGKEKVTELNDRFGDWYYVIDNDVYQKIHLSREDIVKKKESEEEDDENTENGEDDFQPTVDAAGFGKPGEPIPGLPDVKGVLEENVGDAVGTEPSQDPPSEAPDVP